ncbi:OLC1v1019318C1 [Oldenlandia corymbosa var. corymbosa]|uniref:OLC1v1019318C1 n=1 Tax=Oldenlandia corymbosa var. corymbosa TaxID=529605 RepID=A0AAV1EE21_OLDCO|nr:OLC1v1019318C1 [Oldenlandia corymbosa var. corymbosa]
MKTIDQYLEGSPSSSSDINWEYDPLLIPNLPINLINEILLRLPAKSLGRFKCVSKPWLFLISSQRFIKAHLAIASGRDDFGHHSPSFTLVSADGHLGYEVLHYVSSLLYGASSETAIPKVFDIDLPHKSFWAVGSCNGLVLVTNRNNELFLCNPCTKELKKLPKNGMENRHFHHIYGFGYDKLHDDYKVLGLFKILSSTPGGIMVDYELKLFSLRNNLRHEIEVPENVDPGNCKGHYLKYLSGNIYWCITDGGTGRRRWKIVCFDLTNETYGELAQPKNEGRPYDYGLGVLGDRLLTFYDYKKSHADIWVMNDS